MALMIHKGMRKLLLIIFIFLASPFMVLFISCGHKTKAWNTMDIAECLMNSRPDSALSILSSIDKSCLGDDEERARYALLMSMALDKNYIDTTSFDVIQPAIDYYLSKGSADERLRTLYYQGRIFQNMFDFDMAMKCFLKAEDLRCDCTDTLLYANLLVAQGNLYYKSYQINDYILNNLKAANLYSKLGNDGSMQVSLIRALDGCIASKNRKRADSIMPIVDSMVMYVPESQNMLALVKLSYGIGFDSKNTIKSIIDTISNLEDLNDEMKLDISLGYLSLHESEKASNIFALIDTTGMIGQSLRYLSVKPDIFEANKKYSDAFQALKRYQITSEIENSRIYSQKTTVAEELHELMIEHLYSIQRKDRQLWFGVCILLVLIIVVGVVYYQLRLSKKNRIISEQKQSRLQLENENLQKQNFVLGLEKHNAELECERQHLAAENMKLRISQLESEGEHLKELLTEAKLSKPILASIQERIGILNGLLAAKISDNDVYSKPYDKWINQITEDRKSFMDSTRLAFRASHPAFMKYLDDHGLTESELNYVCLYAIGLRGKEIGEYIQLKRHYHMSTDIRKKLGLSEDDTNLGLHIRNLMKNL
jgi:tetratricopeptide (TPR) repeat protein